MRHLCIVTERSSANVPRSIARERQYSSSYPGVPRGQPHPIFGRLVREVHLYDSMAFIVRSTARFQMREIKRGYDTIPYDYSPRTRPPPPRLMAAPSAVAWILSDPTAPTGHSRDTQQLHPYCPLRLGE